MPWTGKEFASRHNHKLKGAAATKAASQATAMVKKGVPEGIAIATANKTGDRVKSAGSPKSRDEHMARVGKHQPQKATAKDFGTSQSTVSRRTMRQGFVSGGRADD